MSSDSRAYLNEEMADLENAGAVRGLAPGEINKMTNAQLKKALTTLVNEDQPDNKVLLEEIRALKEEVKEVVAIKRHVSDLSEKLDEAFRIIERQQLFLESLDYKNRRLNMVITGLSEDADDIGRTDEEKVQKVVESTGYQDDFTTTSWEIKRLGQPNPNKKRPVLVVVNNEHQRSGILRQAKNLKSTPGPLSSVYLKKDSHPAVRKEMARLKSREKEEKEKPENAGVNIVYDWKKRVLLRDGSVIDRFCPYFF